MNTIKNDYSEICRHALNFFGLEAQTRQLMEECGELTRAANHFYRSEGKYIEDADNFKEEIADVFILLNQFCCYYHWVEEVNEIVENKLHRLLEKMESYNEKMQP